MISIYEELKRTFFKSKNNSSYIGHESDCYDCCDEDLIFDDDDADCFCD